MDFSNNIPEEPSAEANYRLPSPRGFNTSTAPNRPLRTPDTILRLLPAIFAIPALTLYCIDIADYHQAKQDNLVLRTSKRVTVVDALSIAFFTISAVIPPVRIIRWTLSKASPEPVNTLSEEPKGRTGFSKLTMSPFWWFGMDFFLWMCCLTMACTTLAIRSSLTNCAWTDWPEACSSGARGRMKAAGALGVLTAVCHQFLWLIPIHMRYDRLFQKEGAWGIDRPSITQ